MLAGNGKDLVASKAMMQLQTPQQANLGPIRVCCVRLCAVLAGRNRRILSSFQRSGMEYSSTAELVGTILIAAENV